MPYFIQKQGDKHCVMKGTKEEPGETVKCHATHKEALDHLRALYVHVEDAKATVTDASANAPHGEGGTLAAGKDGFSCVCPKCGHKTQSDTACKDVQCPHCDASMREVEEDKRNVEKFTVYKSGDTWRWLTVSNVAIEDREGEIVSEKAYDDAIAYAYANNAFGELDLVHIDGTDVGTCDLMARLNTQLIEGGEWYNDSKAQRVREKVSTKPTQWGVSIKFHYDPEQFSEKVYQGGIRILKRTILPRGMAASYGTAIAVTGGVSMKKIDEETKAALSELGLSEDEIAGLVEKQKALPVELNVKEKEGEEPAKPAESDEKVTMKSEADGKHPAGHYLVVEDAEQPSTWHLRVRGTDGKPDHTLMGAAWAALHGGYRGNKYEGPSKEEAVSKLRSIYKGEDMTPPGEKEDEEEGKSLPPVVLPQAPAGFWDSVKDTVAKFLSGNKEEKEPEPEKPATDAGETAKSAEPEVVSETKEVQPESVAVTPTTEVKESVVTEEMLKTWSAAMAQVVATTVAEKVAELTVKLDKFESQQTKMDKELTEAKKSVEQRVMDRINELPPIVKTRVSFADATAQAPIAPPPQPVVNNNWTPQAYAAKMFDDIKEEVAKKRGQNDSDKKVKI
jgi:hypothetical protein